MAGTPGKNGSPAPRKGVASVALTGEELARAREREQKAVALAIAGVDYQRIADELGYADKSGAWRAVHRVLSRHEEPKVRELRLVENARLDRLQEAFWPRAINGDLRAAMFIVRLFERRARLNGLDQQVVRDAGALAGALLGDPAARTERLVQLRDEVAEARARKEADAG